MKVLFVCSGNICRSPMCEGYFKQRAARSGLSHVVIDSAGTLGINGSPASAEAVKIAADHGVDLSSHRSSGLSATDLRTSDLVVVMARIHLEELAHRFPEGRDERLLLRAFEKRPQPDVDAPDLDDPIGRSETIYRECWEILVPCLDHLALHLRHRP